MYHMCMLNANKYISCLLGKLTTLYYECQEVYLIAVPLRNTVRFHFDVMLLFLHLWIFFRGFLKGDKLWGTINHKLHGMETSCEVHESADVSTSIKFLMSL